MNTSQGRLQALRVSKLYEDLARERTVRIVRFVDGHVYEGQDTKHRTRAARQLRTIWRLKQTHRVK